MSEKSLTNKQKALIKELDELYYLSKMDYWNIQKYLNKYRTNALRYQKNHIIRGEVINSYALIDEYLGCLICRYFFGMKKDFIVLWKTKKFKNFNYYVLERLSLLHKLDLVKSIQKIPHRIACNIQAINMLRNGLAHSLFPENRKTCKPIYKDKKIFSLEGLEHFKKDMFEISKFFKKYI